MQLEVLDHSQLLALNESSIRQGRRQNLPRDRFPSKPLERYLINEYHIQEWDGRPEVRMCVVLSLWTGQTSWLDVSIDEFATVPVVDIPDQEWEIAMCAGTPPVAP